MIRNYLKIAVRNLSKHKLFSFINIFGLALSLAVCMIVIVQVKDDLSYDLFHPHPERTFRILSGIVEHKDDERYKLASTPLPLIDEIQKNNIVEKAVQLYPALKDKAAFGDKELSLNGAFTSSSFFEVFGFKLSAGNAKTALALTNGIILSSETASKFFGKANPIGKILSFEKMGQFEVTGVLETPPGKSHISFDAYASSLSVAALERSGVLPQRLGNWNSMNDSYTYVLLNEKSTSESLEGILKQVSSIPALRSANGKINFVGQRLTEITPGTDGIYNEIGKGTVWAKVLTIAGVGFIILLAACFNYTNLTVARALTRAKEVGIRKVSGASRSQVFLQYMLEAVLIALLAEAFGCLLLLQFRPEFHLSFKLSLFVTLFTIVTGAMAGAFPAWILSSFKPVDVLKGQLKQKMFGNMSVQKGLMTFQFAISILIVIFLMAYYRQFTYLSTLDPGFYAKNIMTIPVPAKNKIFATEVSRIGGVENISRISDNFGLRGSGSVAVFRDKPVNAQGINCDYYFTDAATVPLHKLTIVAGTNFSEREESANEKFVMVNEKAVQVLGLKNPANAIGERVWLNDSTPVQVRGVVKDFYHVGVARRITPTLFRNRSDAFNYLNIQVSVSAKEQLVQKVSSVWNRLNPHTPFTYEWLENKIADREDQSDMYATMGFLAFITVSIASLGLLGLVIFTVQTRRKEISIRKVLGSGVNQLMFLLSKDYLKLLVIAGLIAMPLGYVAAFLFLQNFANRVPFGIGSLLAGFLFLLTIGLITILSNTYKISVENPVKHLRLE